jgi:putative addiction module killer protein
VGIISCEISGKNETSLTADFLVCGKSVLELLANYGSLCYRFRSMPTVTGEARPKWVIIYETLNEEEPFTNWLNNLRDAIGRKRILARVARLEDGNYGDCEPVGEGISELRMFFGPGYRVYFGENGNDIVILLCGGDKDSQDKDIQQAKAYWQEYLNREEVQND